tara:strand:+ start:14338 stop:14760 length:423 start_codon:yes stop_codon:yes gene_type:complete
MSITESPLYLKIKSHKTITLGHLFFFENFVVAEFNHGVTLDYESLESFYSLIKEHFGNNDYGLVSNRINSYAIVLSDAPKINKKSNNLKAYATVTYNTLAEKVIEVENHFLKFNKQNFHSLNDAISWVENTLALRSLALN